MEHSTKNEVLVVGASGRLGGLVVDALVSRGASVRAMVRPGNADRFGKRDGVEVCTGDLADADSLRRAVEGMRSVVSCVQGGPEIIVDGQHRLFQIAQEAGVERFVPSDFSFDLFALPEGANINSDWRRAFARGAQALSTRTKVVNVLNGCFLDLGVLFGFLGAFDLRAGTMALWGDGQAPMDFTTYEDTARFTAIAATAAEVEPRFAVAGDTLTFWQLESAVESASGRRLEVIERGSLADLDRLIETRQTAEPHNIYGYLPLMYWRAMLNGDGALRETVNARYPDIQPTTVAQYVAAHAEAFRNA